MNISNVSFLSLYLYTHMNTHRVDVCGITVIIGNRITDLSSNLGEVVSLGAYALEKEIKQSFLSPLPPGYR